MEAFPHTYEATADGAPTGPVNVTSSGLPAIATAPPVQFGGMGEHWSPEALLAGAVADCFVLTFRAIASASKLEWSEVSCDVTATLERVERVTKFTKLAIVARVVLAPGASIETAEKILHKSEANCLITSSLSAEVSFEGHAQLP